MGQVYKILRSLAVFLILLMPCNAYSASYYVSQDTGDDSAAGAEGTPWEHCPGMSGWTGSATLSANDTVYFDSSDTWTANSGTYVFIEGVGGVTYDGATWGGGARAKIDVGKGYDVAVVAFREDDATYETVITGFEIDGNDYGGIPITINRPSIRDMTGATKRIENCVVHHVYGTTYTSQFVGLRVGADSNYNTTNVEILNCTVYNIAYHGIAIYEQYGGAYSSQIHTVLIRGCNIYNYGLGEAPGGYGIMIKNDVVDTVCEFNYIHDGWGYGMDVDCDDGTASPSNTIFRYNIIYNSGKGGIYCAHSGTNERTFYVYGNLIFQNSNTTSSNGQGIHLESDMGGTASIKIFNNTFYDNANGSIRIMPSVTTFNALEVKNNIMYSAPTKFCIHDLNGRITAHNNNKYYKGDGTQETVVYSLTVYYQEANVINYEATAKVGNPNYKNTSNKPTGFTGTYGTDMLPNNDGLLVQSGDCINGGADLGASYDGAINLSGLSGSQTRTGTWDIGAYQLDPTITVTATDAAADEDGGTGEWTIACSPNCTGETINFSYEGSATLDADYDTDDEDGSIVINGANTTITLTPVDDGDIESTETATLRVDVGTGYSVGPPDTANILITDNDNPSPPVGGGNITIGGGSRTITIGGGSHSLTISAE